MSILEKVFNLTTEEQIALLAELEGSASSPLPVSLSKEEIDTFEIPMEVDIEAELAKIKELVIAEVQSIQINAPKGDKGAKGDKGDKGNDGKNGLNGSIGPKGKDGEDGVDGKDGISVVDARIDFDGTLVITLSNGQEINAGDIVTNDKQDVVIQSLKNGALSLIELGIEDYLSSPTPIGNVLPNTGKFTSVTTPSVTATTTDLTLSAISTGAVKFSTLGGLQGQFSNTASAVNYVQVSGAATGNNPTISAQGSDADVGVTLNTKGNGLVRLQTNAVTRFSIDNTGSTTKLGLSASGGVGFQVTATGSQVNFYSTAGTITGLTPTLTASNSADTNVSMAFQPKGTGAIDLAAGSRGVNISNGGTVTAITRTNAGVGYTTAPTWTASAPTTAGGVTATGTTTLLLYSPVVNAGGTGYTVGNVLTVVGGTFSPNAAQLTVTAVSGGVITAVTILAGGTYTTTPTYPASVTGGSGSGATFTLSAGISNLTINNAGSGYVEQPTVTFSGGGGSGASAYASVGNTTTVKGLYGGASQIPIQFAGPSGNLLQIMESGNTSAPTPLVVKGGSSSTQLYANLSNSSIQFSSNGTGVINFYTNTLAAEQLRVAHTASAVNYVQVNGGATGTSPTITAQGSDAAIGLQLVAKTASIVFVTRSGNARSFNIADSVSPVNYLQVQGNTTGVAPILSAQGTDTNIDLALTPKGTGNVRFGTYTGTILTPTGYIEVKDSGGTVRRLLVG